MAIAVYNASTTTSASTNTINIGGSDRYILVFIGGGNYTFPSSVGVNGESLAKLADQDNSTQATQIWGLKNPSVGVGLTVTCNGISGYAWGAVALTGVNQNTPLRGAARKAAGSGTNPNVTATSLVAKDWHIGSVGMRASNPTCDDVQIHAGTKFSSGYVIATGASTNLDFLSGNEDWSVASLILIPSPYELVSLPAWFM